MLKDLRQEYHPFFQKFSSLKQAMMRLYQIQIHLKSRLQRKEKKKMIRLKKNHV